MRLGEAVRDTEREAVAERVRVRAELWLEEAVPVCVEEAVPVRGWVRMGVGGEGSRTEAQEAPARVRERGNARVCARECVC